MTNGEDKRTGLAPVQSTPLARVGANSLAARARSDLRIREESDMWLRRGQELRQQGIDETQSSFEAAQRALDAEVASGRCISPEEKRAFFDKRFLRDPHHRREEAVACFELGLQLSPSHPELQFLLGESLFNGWGIPQNPVDASKWFRKAAEQGHAEAQFKFGWICASMAGSEGSGIPHDDVEATTWWRMAAEQGHAESQHYLGEYYACGFGVEQDYVQAAFWLRKAASHVEDREPRKLRMYSNLASWLKSTAKKRVVDAQFLLGWLYRHGREVPQDYAQASAWYRRAAEQGDAGAQYCLGVAYDNGEGVPQDSAEAATWLRKSAEPCNVDAQFALGVVPEYEGAEGEVGL